MVAEFYDVDNSLIDAYQFRYDDELLCYLIVLNLISNLKRGIIFF